MEQTEVQLFLLARSDWTPEELEREKEEIKRLGHRVVVLPDHKAIGRWRQDRG